GNRSTFPILCARNAKPFLLTLKAKKRKILSAKLRGISTAYHRALSSHFESFPPSPRGIAGTAPVSRQAQADQVSYRLAQSDA
ncbi:MAG: hypothetical protein ACFCVA_08575, partial [Gammaproteobacteria bacterium]